MAVGVECGFDEQVSDRPGSPSFVRVGKDVGYPAQLGDIFSSNDMSGRKRVCCISHSACHGGPVLVLLCIVIFSVLALGAHACPLSLLSDYRSYRLDGLRQSKGDLGAGVWPTKAVPLVRITKAF